MRIVRCLVLLALLIAASACGGIGGLDQFGPWTGTWDGGNAQGSLVLTFSHGDSMGSIDTYDVTVVVSGGQCASPQGETGVGRDGTAVLDAHVHFAVRFGEGDAGVYLFEGTVNAFDAMGGSYSLQSASCPACTCGLGASGTWQVTR